MAVDVAAVPPWSRVAVAVARCEIRVHGQVSFVQPGHETAADT